MRVLSRCAISREVLGNLCSGNDDGERPCSGCGSSLRQDISFPVQGGDGSANAWTAGWKHLTLRNGAGDEEAGSYEAIPNDFNPKDVVCLVANIE